MNCNILRMIAWATLAVTSFLATGTVGAKNLLVNSSFREKEDNLPANWSVRDNRQEVSIDADEANHPESAQTLRVDIVTDGGSSYGQIAQAVSVQPNTEYRFAGDWRSSKGQTAFLQIKRIKSRKELERIHLGWSNQAWQRVVKHVNSGEADTLEVICRYRQKPDFVGSVCWYTNLSLSEVSESMQAEDAVTAISEPLPPPPIKTREFDFPKENPNLKTAAPGVDRYVTLGGAGDMTGTDWKNASSAQNGGLQAAWDDIGPGNTLYLGSGEYRDAILEIKAGGSGPMAMRRLQGIDTGGGLPVFVGSLDMDSIRSGWQTMLVGTADTGYWELNGLRYRNCSCAVKLYGGNTGVRLKHLGITRVREGFTLQGMTDPRDRFATRDIAISDCTVKIYTKRGVRIRDGVSDLRIDRVAVDAGGKEWFREAFPIGFQVDSELNLPECRDITFTDCTAVGNWYPNGNDYWNADGFCAERHARNLRYVRCRAMNNTDGGWDDKSANPVLIDCVSLCNKRNYRFWSKPGPARLQNCVSAYAIDYRSGTPGIGLWQASGSYVQIENSTFYANGCAVRIEADGNSSRCELTSCVLAGDKEAKHLAVESGGEVSKTDTIEGTIGDVETDPQLIAPTPEWNGSGNGFNSHRFPNHGARFQ